MGSPLLVLALNVIAALAVAAVLSLTVKTLARTVPGFAWLKATREISRVGTLVEQLRDRDPTRMMMAMIVRQFSIYLILSLVMVAAIVACLATRGSHFDEWFPVAVAVIGLLFQKTHEDYTRASELLQRRNPGIDVVAARVRTFYLAMNDEQRTALDAQLDQLSEDFDTLGQACQRRVPAAPPHDTQAESAPA